MKNQYSCGDQDDISLKSKFLNAFNNKCSALTSIIRPLLATTLKLEAISMISLTSFLRSDWNTSNTHLLCESKIPEILHLSTIIIHCSIYPLEYTQSKALKEEWQTNDFTCSAQLLSANDIFCCFSTYVKYSWVWVSFSSIFVHNHHKMSLLLKIFFFCGHEQQVNGLLLKLGCCWWWCYKIFLCVKSDNDRHRQPCQWW